MNEPTCKEIDEYLSRKFDGWEPCNRQDYKCAGHMTRSAPTTNQPPTRYCGPSADPILGLITRERLRFTLDQYEDCVCEVYLKGYLLTTGLGVAETCARAVYAMLREKEKHG